MDAALVMYRVDISKPKSLPAYHLYSARWSPTDPTYNRWRSPPPRLAATSRPEHTRRAPASGLGAGGAGDLRRPLKYEHTVLAGPGTAVREKLRAIVATRGRTSDIVRHQQGAMPAQPLAPDPAALPPLPRTPPSSTTDSA
ncbi:hypothetical protein ABZ650_33125 [Streptomyces griseoviridis]|uniref:hypothetical protein n=1 Tax=Streptomyces griseoviridis TaxID=45398 RepID=UPI0033C7ADD7